MKLEIYANVMLAAIANRYLSLKGKFDLKPLSNSLMMGFEFPSSNEYGRVRFKEEKTFLNFKTWLDTELNNATSCVSLAKLKEFNCRKTISDNTGIPEILLSGLKGSGSIVLNSHNKNFIKGYLLKMLEFPVLESKYYQELIPIIHSLTNFASIKEILFKKASPYFSFKSCDSFESLEKTIKDLDSYEIENATSEIINFLDKECANFADNDRKKWEDFSNLRELKVYMYQYNLISKSEESIHLDSSINIDHAKIKLCDSLERISDFAQKHNENSWADFFKNRLLRLNSKEKENSFNIGEYIQLKLSQKAVFLFMECGAISDCFGGMLSWNDVSCMHEKEYSDVSLNLLEAMEDCFIAIANSTILIN